MAASENFRPADCHWQFPANGLLLLRKRSHRIGRVVKSIRLASRRNQSLVENAVLKSVHDGVAGASRPLPFLVDGPILRISDSVLRLLSANETARLDDNLDEGLFIGLKEVL